MAAPMPEAFGMLVMTRMSMKSLETSSNLWQQEGEERSSIMTDYPKGTIAFNTDVT